PTHFGGGYVGRPWNAGVGRADQQQRADVNGRQNNGNEHHRQQPPPENLLSIPVEEGALPHQEGDEDKQPDGESDGDILQEVHAQIKTTQTHQQDVDQYQNPSPAPPQQGGQQQINSRHILNVTARDTIP